jgi:hypothetical protein
MDGAADGALDGTTGVAAMGWLLRQFPIRNHRFKKPHRNGQKIPQPNIPQGLRTATAYSKYGTIKRKRKTTACMVLYFAIYILFTFFSADVRVHANFLAFSNIILPSTAEQYDNT